MTREEAIKILSYRDAHGVPCGYASGFVEALDVAIEIMESYDKMQEISFDLASENDDLLEKIQAIKAEIDKNRENPEEKIFTEVFNAGLKCALDIINKHIQNTCDRCGKVIDHYGLCEECDKWLEDNYGEGKKNV